MKRAFLRAALFVIACLGACQRSAVPDAAITFVREGHDSRSLTLRELAERTPPRVVETNDPYYRAHKRFYALELEGVLTHAFGLAAADLRALSFVLKASDGYAVPIDGERLLEGGAFLAYDDVDVPGFAPIGPQRVSPKPVYFVWTRASQESLDTHPRPWQLVSIEIASYESRHPRTIPTGEPRDGPAMRGFALFRDHCVKCHAMNREGGRVGPELNVPQNILDYRPEQQVRAYIRNPLTFRYGAMPAHPSLTDGDLDALVAYFRAMSTRKHDPDATRTP